MRYVLLSMSRDRNGYRLYLKRSMRKTSEVANLQDLLLFVVRGIAVYNEHLRRKDILLKKQTNLSTMPCSSPSLTPILTKRPSSEK